MKILYITTHYDPAKSVSANRVHDLLSFFANKNLSVTVVSPGKVNLPNTKFKSIVLPFESTHETLPVMRFIKNFFTWDEGKKNTLWVKQVEAYFIKHAQQLENFDVVLINVCPMILVKLAKFFKQKADLPITVDIHDSLAFDVDRTILFFKEKALQNYEKLLFKYVDVVFAFTPSMQKIYKKNFPWLDVKFVPTAIADKLQKLPSSQNKIKKTISASTKDEINIIYGGSLFGTRTIFPLLKALSFLKNHQFKIKILGTNSNLTKFRYQKYPEVEWLKKIPKNEYYDFFVNYADIGLVVQSFFIKEPSTSAIAAKTYDYLLMNKPIIYLGPKGDNTAIIQKYANSYCLVTQPSQDIVKLAKFLKNFKTQKQNTKPEYFHDYQPNKVYAIVVDTFKELIAKRMKLCKQ